MKPCLVDANVLLSLLVAHHEHHEAALRWYGGLQKSEAGICRFVQVTVIRLLGNRAIMSDRPLSALAAWKIISELLEDERFEFVTEPSSIDATMPKLLNYPVPTNKLVTDVYLAAFSIAADVRFTTFDAGFRQFHGLDLDLLAT